MTNIPKSRIVVFIFVILCVAYVLFLEYATLHSSEQNSRFSIRGSSVKSDKATSDDSILVVSNNTKLQNLLLQFNSEINFFGRVIAQDGKPLKGAKVSYNIQMSGDLQPQFGLQRKDGGVLYSSDDGTFQILKKKGMTLDIAAIELDGYREALGGTRRGYNYGSASDLHHADPKRPIEFLLISQNASKIIGNEHELAFKWDSIPVSIPIGESADTIVFIPRRNRQNNEIMDFDWSLDISVHQGEISRLPAGAAPIAPVRGYQNSVRYGYLATDTKWIGGVGQETLAFKTAEGKYGRIELHLYANRDDNATAAFVTVYFNPTGGRNLE